MEDSLFKTFSPIFPEFSAPSLSAALLNCGHELRTQPNYVWDGMKRGDREFLIWQYTLKGEGEFILGEAHYPIPPGSAMLAIVPEKHLYRLPSGSPFWEFIYISLPGSENVRLAREFRRQYGPVVRFAADSEPVKMVKLLLNTPALLKQDRFMVSAFAYRFMMALFSAGSREEQTADNGWLRQIHDYAVTHIRRPLDVEELAAAVHCSRWHFTRKFEAACGQSPHRFVTDLKMRLAVRLLQTTFDSVKEIAQQCGFADTSYFCKVFRRTYGVTPAGFRDAARGKSQTFHI